jgi:hypothetical protein
VPTARCGSRAAERSAALPSAALGLTDRGAVGGTGLTQLHPRRQLASGYEDGATDPPTRAAPHPARGDVRPRRGVRGWPGIRRSRPSAARDEPTGARVPHRPRRPPPRDGEEGDRHRDGPRPWWLPSERRQQHAEDEDGDVDGHQHCPECGGSERMSPGEGASVVPRGEQQPEREESSAERRADPTGCRCPRVVGDGSTRHVDPSSRRTTLSGHGPTRRPDRTTRSWLRCGDVSAETSCHRISVDRGRHTACHVAGHR